MSHHALIVDDEQDILSLLQRVLSRMGIETFSATTLGEASALLETHAPDIHFCITDMRLPDGNGIDLVKKISTEYPDIPVAMITAYGSVETAVEALQAGAFDFVSKPIELDVLRKLITNALRQAGNAERQLSEDNETRLIGNSPVMQALYDQVSRVAPTEATVLLIGEGANRYSAGQKRQRYSEARGEAGEVAAAAQLLAVLYLVPQTDADTIIALAGRVAAMLTRLIQRHR